MIRAFLFDIGNVLVRFDFSRAMKRLGEQSTRPVDEITAAIQALLPDFETGNISTAEFLSRARRDTGFSGTPEELATAYCDIFFPHEPTWAVVESLGQRYPLYLFSNTSELHESFLLAEYRIFSRFRGGVFSWRERCMKPSAAFYQAGIDLIGLPADEIFYLDDSLANIEAGRAAGMQTHQYLPDRHSELETALREAGVEA